MNTGTQNDWKWSLIINIKPFVEIVTDTGLKAQSNMVINYDYFHFQRGKLKQLINKTAYNALNGSKPDPMEDDIDLANHSIRLTSKNRSHLMVITQLMSTLLIQQLVTIMLLLTP